MPNFKFETHLHTKETSSCAMIPAEVIPELYSKLGYDGMAVTDHYYKGFFERRFEKSWNECVDDYLEGYRILKKNAGKVNIQVILGMELSFESLPNDYLVYGFDETFLYENPRLYKLDVKGFSKLAKENNLFFAQAHPFRGNAIRVDTHLLDGMEAFNKNKRHVCNNNLAYEYAVKNGLIKLSGSDFHQMEDLGMGGIIIDELVGSSKEFAAYLLNRENRIELMGG